MVLKTFDWLGYLPNVLKTGWGRWDAAFVRMCNGCGKELMPLYAL